ncbi:MAG: PASTA domain-containing protein [Bacteroidales bacterium]|nr:PASTA domain-containing protein [Bacteroidales bacterium]
MSKGFFSNWIVKNILGAVALILGLTLMASILLGVVTRHSKVVEVPDFTNMTQQQASALAAEKGIRVEVTDSIYARRRTGGAVVNQNPYAGVSVKPGRRVMLTINALHPKMVAMPDLIGVSMRQAKAELRSKGLSLGRIIYVSDMATNNVLRQLYRSVQIKPGTPIESEATVDLVVGLSTFDCTTNVPDVTGFKYSRAVDVIHDYSLNVGHLKFDETVKNYDDSLNAMVYLQSPAASDAVCDMGSEVSISLTLDEGRISKF